jgi:predicted nucleotidyltransferase
MAPTDGSDLDLLVDALPGATLWTWAIWKKN